MAADRMFSHWWYHTALQQWIKVRTLADDDELWFFVEGVPDGVVLTFWKNRLLVAKVYNGEIVHEKIFYGLEWWA